MSTVANGIFVFGPSCSGKSTLSTALAKTLGRTWKRIDRDDLIEKEGVLEDQADQALEKRIVSLQQNNFRVIVDTQIPWREKQEGEYYVLLLPPLHIFLERDGERTKKQARDPLMAIRAREYVEETHGILEKRSKQDITCLFDLVTPVKQAVTKVILFLEISPLFGKQLAENASFAEKAKDLNPITSLIYDYYSN